MFYGHQRSRIQRRLCPLPLLLPSPPRDTGPLLVGDTIATGTTLAGILSVAVAEMEAHGNVRDVVCLTVAGSSFCAQHPRLLELDERLARHGRHLVMVFANAQVCRV